MCIIIFIAYMYLHSLRIHIMYSIVFLLCVYTPLLPYHIPKHGTAQNICAGLVAFIAV